LAGTPIRFVWTSPQDGKIVAARKEKKSFWLAPNDGRPQAAVSLRAVCRDVCPTRLHDNESPQSLPCEWGEAYRRAQHRRISPHLYPSPHFVWRVTFLKCSASVMKTGVISQAAGSAYMEMHQTKVICGVCVLTSTPSQPSRNRCVAV